jgi:hypothetical protein
MTETAKSSLEAFLTKSTPEPAQPPVVETTVEAEKVSQPAEVNEPRKADDPTVVESWDKSANTDEPKASVQDEEPYFQKLAKKVGIQVKDEDELVSKLKADPYEGLPTNLKKAIDFAKKDGDFLQLLKVSAVDYNTFDPVQLFEADVLSKAPNKEEAKDWLSTLSPVQKQIEGQRLKDRLIFQQQQQEQDLYRSLEATKQAQAAEKQKAIETLQNAVDNTEAVEVAGYKFKLDAKHKKALVNSIASGEFWKDDRYQTSKGFDISRKIKDEFLTSNWQSVETFLTERIKTSTLKQVAEEVQNVQLDKTNSRDQVELKPTPLFLQLNEQFRNRK